MKPGKTVLAAYVVGLALSGAAVEAADSPYAPVPQPERTFDDLRQDLETELRGIGRYVRVKPYKGFPVISYDGVRAVRSGSDWTEIEFTGAIVTEAKPTDGIFIYRLDYGQLAELNYDAQTCAPRYIALPDGMEFRYAEPATRRLCDTMFNLGQRYRERREQADAHFDAAVARYHAGPMKPAVTEDMRRLIVQAEMLRERKDYRGATERFRKLVELDSVAYPAAYFNLALLYEQQEMYPRAIEAMRKYLKLQPTAADARAAQDKIYGWEMLAGDAP